MKLLAEVVAVNYKTILAALAVMVILAGIALAAPTVNQQLDITAATTSDTNVFNVSVQNAGAEDVTSVIIDYSAYAAASVPTNIVCGNGFAQSSTYPANSINCTNVSAPSALAGGSTAINITFTKTAPSSPNTTASQYGLNVTSYGTSGSYSSFFGVQVTDNDAPSVSLSSPANSTTSAANITFQYTVTDNSNTYGSCYVYGNFSGAWAEGQTNQTAVGSGTNSINMTLTDGTYIWNVNCSDTSGNSAFNAANRILTVDATPPVITTRWPTETQTSGTVIIAVTTNENANCRYDTNYTAKYPNMANTFSSTDSMMHYQTLNLSNGDYNYYVLCRDAMGNIMTTATNIAFSVSIPKTTTGETAASSEPSETQGVSGVPAGTSTTVTMANPSIIATSLEIKAAQLILNGQITVTQSSSQPTSVTAEAGGKAYKYIIIDKTGIADTAVQSAKVRFRVLKSWMIDNGYGTADIVLSRYSNGAWADLTTRLTNEGSAEYFFEADSPGLSVYVIRAVKAAAAPSPATAPVTAGENITNTSGEALPEEQPMPGYTVTVIVVVLLAVAAAGIWYYMKSEKEFKRLPWRRNVGFESHGK